MRLIKLLLLAAVTITSLNLTACNEKDAKESDFTEVKVGVVGDYNAHWEKVNELLAKDKIKIKLVKFSDYAIPNRALADKEIDLNAFQHEAFFLNDIKRNNYNLISLCQTFIAPIRIYNNKEKVKSLEDIHDGSIIGIPSDLTNGGRALKLLEQAGLIEVDKAKGFVPTKADILKYNVKIEIREAESGVLNNILPDMDAACINGGNAFSANLKPSDAIFSENPNASEEDNPYVNIIAARAEDKNNEVYQKVIKTFRSDEVRKTIIDAYDGGYIPVF